VHSIVDHHKLSGLRTSAPLEADIRPICSTGSVKPAAANLKSTGLAHNFSVDPAV
jgi:inorganic pyrophosphatase/exopolyphosphatase